MILPVFDDNINVKNALLPNGGITRLERIKFVVYNKIYILKTIWYNSLFINSSLTVISNKDP